MLDENEKEKRRMEDMLLTTRTIRNEIGKSEIVSLPEQYKLEQNYPNPFNPITVISYSIPNTANVKIKIFDITGREIRQLINEVKEAGRYEIKFDGSNLATGIYFYKLESGSFVSTKRMVLIK